MNGPKVYFPPYGTTLSYKKRPALTLSSTQFAIATDGRTGARRVLGGPGAVFLGAYETASDPKACPSLTENEAITVLDSSTGARQLLRGPRVWTPTSPYETAVDRQTARTLKSGEYAKVADLRTGGVRGVA